MSKNRRYSFGQTRNPKAPNLVAKEAKKRGYPWTKSLVVEELVLKEYLKK